MKSAGLPRSEMLKNKSEIQVLFKKGKHLSMGDVQMKWQYVDSERIELAKVMFAVPKKRFGKAVQRNLLKRRMREAYRQNKSGLISCLEEGNKKVNLMFVLQADQELDFQEIEGKIVLLLKEIIQSCEQSG